MPLAGIQISPEVAGVAVALGVGLLVGLERERRKGRGADRAAAGLRTFMIASLTGALAAAAPWMGLVPVALLAVSALAALSHWKSRARDPGMTTEMALIVTCLIGALAVPQPALAAGAGALLAGLLAARDRLHRFATRLLSEAELHDALWLAAIALVLLPLVPNEPLPWLAGLRPRLLVALVVLILLLQAAGHVALRIAGPRAGLALSGLFGGLVSSTATIAAMGARARAHPPLRAACEGGALLSTAATWLQIVLMLAAIAPAAARAVLPPAIAAVAVALAGGWWRGRGHLSAHDEAHARAPQADGALRLREAALVAVILSAVTLLVGWMQQQHGTGGLLAGIALGALADAQSGMAALGSMQVAGRITTNEVVGAVLVAVATNSTVRSATAFAAGGPRFGRTVLLSLLASTAAAAATAWALA
jgi:uncharacterized membrane protein (DUF4010 family)